jgi:hypothetical protein
MYITVRIHYRLGFETGSMYDGVYCVVTRFLENLLVKIGMLHWHEHPT